MIARRGPKLALAVPRVNVPASTAQSPLPPTFISPTPISPAVRDSCLSQHGHFTAQLPTFAYAQPSNTKSILKKGHSSRSMPGKKLSFNEEPAVRSIEKLPQEYYGEYVKLSKEDRRWGKGL